MLNNGRYESPPPDLTAELIQVIAEKIKETQGYKLIARQAEATFLKKNIFLNREISANSIWQNGVCKNFFLPVSIDLIHP